MTAHPEESSDRSSNLLKHETSLYLLQHAHNPVHWHPWGEGAFARAKAENKPIFLSVGYSACHWCHVMERESFENPEIAEMLNNAFVNVKVDREERPDVDQIYMAAVQAMNQGHGGWPMSVFLTPEGSPFFAGTYYPPKDQRGMPGFPRVIQSVAQAWRDRPGLLIESAREMTEILQRELRLPDGETPLEESLVENAARALGRQFDSEEGGFGAAPKFPHPMNIQLLLRHYARTQAPHSLHMVRFTLDKMARGGIYDHLGGGFARYSTDARWLVPHFEKMLYDNALLATAYLEAFQVTGDPEYAEVIREVLDYVLERMTAPEGGFYATEDADSEGVEGKYYVWSRSEIETLLGRQAAARFCTVYHVTESGNFEHSNILNRTQSWSEMAAELGMEEAVLRAEMLASRRRLKAVRELRVAPGKDTKIITSWNGLMIGPMARAGRVLREPRYLQAANAAAAFFLTDVRKPDGRLWHTYQQGRARFDACLDDYANLIDGLTRLFEADGDANRLFEAVSLADIMIEEFRDPADGGFYFTGKRHEKLITRPKELYDNATPSGNGMAATALARLAVLTDRADYREIALSAVSLVHGVMETSPAAVAQSLIALDVLCGPVRTVVVTAPSGSDETAGDWEEVLSDLAQVFRPRDVVIPQRLSAGVTVLETLCSVTSGKPYHSSKPIVYVCSDGRCAEPWVGTEMIRNKIAGSSY